MYRKIGSDSPVKLGTVLVILAVLASAMVVLFMLHAETDDSSAEILDKGQCGERLTYTYSSDGTLMIYGSGKMDDYSEAKIPWLDYSSDVKRIIVGDKVTSLCKQAFSSCTNLKELTIPITLDSAESDDHPAFASCTNIEKINLTYGTNGYGPKYEADSGNGSWYRNTPWYLSRDSLKELNLDDRIVGIGSNTFRELNITSLVLPNSLTIAGDHCFLDCSKLTDLSYPISLKPFCNSCYPSFQGCTAIEKITLTSGNGSPYDNQDPDSDYVRLAPWNINSDVAKAIIIPDIVSELVDYMFYGANIKEVTLPISIDFYESVKTFGAIQGDLEKVTITKGSKDNCDNILYGFSPWDWGKNIKTVIVEDGVTSIGGWTFKGCTIGNLVLPNSLSSFGQRDSFFCCTIKELTIPISLNATWDDCKPAFHNVSGIEKVTFTPGSGRGFNYNAYPVNNCWYQNTPWYQSRSTLKEIVFEDGIKSIGSDAFRELNITSVVIPDSVRSLGNHTFFHCDKLTDITLPITLDAVYNNTWPAFDQCNAITTVRLTAGDSGIGCNYASDHLPVWCNPSHKASTIIFDEGIIFLGFHEFEGFTFTGSDGSVMEPTAKNLSGHTFTGKDGNMCQAN